jgi:hypothetical protein
MAQPPGESAELVGWWIENQEEAATASTQVEMTNLKTPPSDVSTDLSGDSDVEIIVDTTLRSLTALEPATTIVETSSAPLKSPDQNPGAQKHNMTRKAHMEFLGLEDGTAEEKHETRSAYYESLTTAPLFSGPALDAAETDTFQQYGLLAQCLDLNDAKDKECGADIDISNDPRLYTNVSAPQSTFICGSQGSGKSHTLSCLLESAILSSELGKLPNPLAGIVFHYDSFAGFGSSQFCEAAYLSSAGIPVKVLVSPTNFQRMKNVYENLPGLDRNAPRPKVLEMRFHEKQLDISKLMTLMAVSEKGGPVPLYVEVCTLWKCMISY